MCLLRKIRLPITALLGCSVLAAQATQGREGSDSLREAASALSAHQYQQTLQILEPLLKQHPADPRLWTLRGLALDGSNQTELSVKSFDHALALNPKFLPALEGAAQTTYLHRDPRAKQYVDRLLAMSPENQVANAMAGALAYQAHECKRALSSFQKAGSALDQSPEGANEFADCLLKNNETSEAVNQLSRAVALHPDSTRLKYNLAVCEVQNHDPEAAIRILSPLANNGDSGLLNLLAFAYAQADRPDDAFATLEAAIRIDPSDETNYLDLAILCLEHNQESRSVQAATAGIGKVPKPAELYLIRGVSYAQLADYEKAESDFLAAAQAEPDQPHSAVAMSLLYSDRNQVDKEKALLQHQLKLTPKDAVTNYLLADLLIRSGATPGQSEFQEAVKHLATSLDARPDSAEGQVLMGKLLEQQGKLPDALGHYNLALKAEPENRTALDRKFVLLRKLHREQESTEVLAQLKVVIRKELKQGTAQVRVDSNAPPL